MTNYIMLKINTLEDIIPFVEYIENIDDGNITISIGDYNLNTELSRITTSYENEQSCKECGRITSQIPVHSITMQAFVV